MFMLVSEDTDSPELYMVSDLTRHCILHAAIGLSPTGIRLPGSGSHRIEQFCKDILALIHGLADRV